MKQPTHDQMKAVQRLAVEALTSMGFGSAWLNELSRDLEMDCDRSCNLMELARYIAWHMEHNKFKFGMSTCSNEHFTNCAFQAITFGANEALALKIV